MASGSSVGGGSGSSNGVESNSVVNAKYPLWAHVSKVLIDETRRGGNTRFCCHFCNLTFPGSYSRVKNHLMTFCFIIFIHILDISPNHCFLKSPYPVSPYSYRRIRLAVSVLRRIFLLTLLFFN
jgi:hypothetical protein